MTIPDSNDPVKTLSRLIDAIDIAMLTTADVKGQLESRPMASQGVDANGMLWFFAARSSHLVACIRQDLRVNVAYAHPGKQRYISITGSAAVVDDHGKRREHWRPAYAQWFPQGVDDPDLVLLNIQIDHVDYWEDTSTLMLRLVGFAKAILGGERETVTSSHGRLAL